MPHGTSKSTTKKEQQNQSLEKYFLYLQDLYIISVTTDILQLFLEPKWALSQ